MYTGELEHGESSPTAPGSVKTTAQMADIRSRRSAQMQRSDR
jgi:hypothetical protein